MAGSHGCGKEVITLGPLGGQGGLHWDDGVYSAVKQIEIAHGAGIDSIKIEYAKNGASVWSEKHGGKGGFNIDRVRFDDDEFLVSIHGYYGSVQGGPLIVRSLTLRSNKRTFGPYGVEQGTPFSLPMSRGKIIGFHGKAGWFLDAIGVYFEPSQKYGLTTNAIVHHSHRYVSHATEKYEYQMIQGNLGQDYELLVALKRKDDTSYFPPEIRTTPISYPPKHNGGSVVNFHPEIHTIADPHHGVTNSEHKIKVPSAAPAKIEKVPSKRVPQGVKKDGPWGGEGGTEFDDGVNDGIRQIHISRNVGIVSIRVCYERNGEAVWGSKNGGTGGLKTNKVVLDYPAEILTRVAGYCGPTTLGMGPTIIKSLTFYTTKGKYGPYGEEKGKEFSSKLQPGMIVGFYGKGGLFLDSIGVYLLEGENFPLPSKPVNQNPVASALPHHAADTSSRTPFKLGKNWVTQDEAVQRIVKDPAPYGPGPWGGEGGKPWDDGVFTGIKQIILSAGDQSAIFSIEIEYDRNGQSVWSVKHGGNGGKTTHRVKLDYPNEVLTCISGYYGPISKDYSTRAIKSLTFYTTRGKIGPFGEEIGSYFTSNTTEGKVVGFHGRCGSYLDAIGVHMQHWLGYQKATKPSPLKKMFS